MNSTNQFWNLLKFQTRINPSIWVFPFVMGVPLFSSFLFSGSGSYHPSLSLLLSVQNLFFVGILAPYILGQEFQFGALGAARTAWILGSEFLLTRAIDRPILYRSKSALLYLIVLALPLIAIVWSLKDPDLTVSEYSRNNQMECLSHISGSTLKPNPTGSSMPLIFIPSGNVLIQAWHFWIYLGAVIGVQVLMTLLSPFKWRAFIFYFIVFAFIFAPIFIDLHSALGKRPGISETLFFGFAAHQLLFWIFTLLAAILVQLWCERRFSRMEQ